MADNLKHKVIQKNDPDFPAYLDFDKLRSEGIAHLGNLAGKVWTDHNVHDPGITILEMLCYALLDLGYRMNLPQADLLSRNPDDKSTDNNFFTPAQILACNPLTVTDYRKLLVDTAGVRNAWLLPATDVKDFCRPTQQTRGNITGALPNYCNPECDDAFLNGLYHVYLDLENPPAGKDQQEFENETVAQVKKSLMEHRNLCEDFEDIFILCKLPMGVCANLELEEKAVPDKVYLAVAEALRSFFTPAPRFYTLQQLLEKGKSMEDVFAGRPYNITQSHGFVDTDEFEKIALRKEIHLSDVYNVLLAVPGVKAVQNLGFRSCDGSNTIINWKISIPENHITEFSAACSGFRFLRNSQLLPVDFKKYAGLLALNFSHSGKVLYQTPSPYLDADIPKGLYRNDLTHYYSVQNEFPRVYGLEAGGLPYDAPALRTAQALQLKGYLLFFDQLLANYVMQLGNIRSLFALSSPEAEDEQHTYFTSQLTTVPDLPKLLRFGTGEAGATSSMGTEGSTLVFPVSKKKLLELKEQDELKCLPLDKIGYCENPGESGSPLQVYTFASLAEQATAICQLKNDFYNEAVTVVYVAQGQESVFYYLLSSSEDIVLLSKKCYKSIAAATQQASSVKYIGNFDENYRTYTDSAGNFSFDIELNLASFPKYLQLIAEDRGLYLQRRQGFLEHLLARFSENFTDYALLLFGTLSKEQSQEATIKATEFFLQNYPDLSSNRARAYNYRANGWTNGNVSGFEKKVKAISGIENWTRHSLCNFEVYKYKEQFEVTLALAGRKFFTLSEKFTTRAAALEAAPAFFKYLSAKAAFNIVELPQQQAFAITLQQDNLATSTYAAKYSSVEEAQQVKARLQQLFAPAATAPESAVFVSHSIYFLQLLDSKGNVVRTSVKNYDSYTKAQSIAERLTTDINNPDLWQAESEETAQTGQLFRDPHNTEPPQFIDLAAFKIDIRNTILNKPKLHTYDLLDRHNRFKFVPVQDFDNETTAEEHARNLLALLSNAAHYQIRFTANTKKYTLQIIAAQEAIAVCTTVCNSEKEAQHLQNEILFSIYEHLYTLAVQELPHNWKYTFETGLDTNAQHTFESTKSYSSFDAALLAATAFRQVVSKLQLHTYKDELRLETGTKSREFSAVKLSVKEDADTIKNSIEVWQQIQAEVNRLQQSATTQDYEASVAPDFLSQQGPYVYRLVDKDNMPAAFSQSYSTKTAATEKARELSEINCDTYQHLEICLGGGDIIHTRKHPRTQQTYYHYLIKSRNRFTTSGDELVLFESTIGYTSIAEAEKAFNQHYVHILHLASAFENYGKTISIEEDPVYTSDACSGTQSIVFIPKTTLNLLELGGYDEAVLRALMALATSYPIRVVAEKSEEYYLLFPCEEKPANKPKGECRTGSEQKYVYYFRLNGLAQETEQPPFWQSTAWYTSPEAARKVFNFFKMLLCYPGNFTVNCNNCTANNETSYRIYVREVLAESTERFNSEADAWGEAGIQKFICMAQSEAGFQTYLNKESCCFSFFVSCADFVHPCPYDTPQKRDISLKKLYTSGAAFFKSNAWHYTSEQNNSGYTFLNGQGIPFAHASIQNPDQVCSSLVDFLQKVRQKQVTYRQGGESDVFVQADETGVTVSSSGASELALWQQTLEAFACYFPVVPETDQNGKVTYCIELKLPGYSLCEPTTTTNEAPCGCRDVEPETPPACPIAWKSRCCFTSCYDALQKVKELALLLANPENYRALFNCDCHEYGIGLYQSPYNNSEITNRNRGLSTEIVAVNPQCYAHPEMACEAVERAQNLINSEGLHTVEHILLRPRCEPDCNCDAYRAFCDKTNCCFTWFAPDTDPCADRPTVCFQPGHDPYSFIATVALPAWPIRFRKPENRQLLENILYREAPAHVLLRILWLAPHDFCCFERKYKNWGQWLARKPACIPDFSTCDFVSYLYYHTFECLKECTVCLPCNEQDELTVTCFAESAGAKADPLKFQNQVNALYCWRKQCEEVYEFIPCTAPFNADDQGRNSILLASENTPVEPLPEGPRTYKTKESIEPNKLADLLKRRITFYRNTLESIVPELEHEELAQQVKASVKAPLPSAKKTAALLSALLHHAAYRTILKKQKLALQQNLLAYYLDKVYFGRKVPEKTSVIERVLNELQTSIPDRKAMYDYWNPEEIEPLQPAADVEVIRKMLIGETG